jgi:glutaminyl-tRNA synthetase
MSAADTTSNFLKTIIQEDIDTGATASVVTRFPPEPNGYLHIGHAKSIYVNFGLAEEFGGVCNLRFDDTNPEKESIEFVEAIKADIEWLGYKWAGEPKYASNYFGQLYDWAVHLVKESKAYVCELSAEEAREHRGTLTEPGRNSPYRDRSIEENLELLEKMKSGEMEDGSASLRAKIDMASGNINMRDPVLYRIRHVTHHHTGDDWKIYPSYDFAHGQEDAIEGVTHSICTLEFADHKPLYDWLLENMPVPAKPVQYEFARLNPNYTLTSKRKLKTLVDKSVVDGWGDPRMPTISGLRRRGYTPSAIRRFCEMTGVSRANSQVDLGMLEFAIRDELDKSAPRSMCVLRPLKVVLTNYSEDKSESMTGAYHPQNEDMGSREVPFSREIWIEQEDFREEANKKYKRLVIGKRVRLRNAYIIEADEAIKDAEGNIVEVRARIIENTVGNDPEDGIRAKGVIHWVDVATAVPCKVNLYSRLFTHENPGTGGADFMDQLNPESLVELTECFAEASLANAKVGQGYQFERQGYFCRDSAINSESNSESESLVFNQTIGLRDGQGKFSA